jgi:hypothetical protein
MLMVESPDELGSKNAKNAALCEGPHGMAAPGSQT